MILLHNQFLITLNELKVLLKLVSVVVIDDGSSNASNSPVVLEMHEQSSKIWNETKKNCQHFIRSLDHITQVLAFPAVIKH